MFQKPKLLEKAQSDESFDQTDFYYSVIKTTTNKSAFNNGYPFHRNKYNNKHLNPDIPTNKSLEIELKRAIFTFNKEAIRV